MNMSDFQRVNGWVTGARALREHPWRWLFGWGPETFRSIYRLHRTQHASDVIGPQRIADHAHNLPLELLLTLGAVGTAAFIYLVWTLWRDASDEGRACMLGLGVMSMVEPLFFPPAAMLCLLLGAGCREYRWLVNDEGAWARVAAGVLAVFAIGMWVDDVTGRGRSLTLHPHESEANQLAVADALGKRRPELAVIYARRAAAADPTYRELVAQTAALEATVLRLKNQERQP